MVKFTAWLGACALLAGSVASLGTNYEHDAKTTYCWAIPQPTNKTKLTEDDRTPDYAGPDNCPFALTVTLSNATVHAFEAVTVQWTVTAQFTTASNPVNQTKIYFGKDSTGKQAQIVHSNVHSCVFGTGCDPFNDGKQLVDKTVNKVANFTDNAAIFNDTMTFIEPGEYSVLAHIILPNAGAASRFDYAVYSKLVVLAATAAPAPTSPTTAPEVVTPAPASAKSSGLSQEATVGIIVGGIVAVVALAVVAVVLRRRKNPANNNYHPAPVSDVHDGGNNKMYHSDVTMTNSTTGFESAWGGDKPHSSTLDNTNQSNQSNGSSGYAAATTTGAFSYETGSTFGKAMQMQDLAASTQSVTTTGRKKRQDSDVEL